FGFATRALQIGERDSGHRGLRIDRERTSVFAFSFVKPERDVTRSAQRLMRRGGVGSVLHRQFCKTTSFPGIYDREIELNEGQQTSPIQFRTRFCLVRGFGCRPALSAQK